MQSLQGQTTAGPVPGLYQTCHDTMQGQHSPTVRRARGGQGNSTLALFHSFCTCAHVQLHVAGRVQVHGVNGACEVHRLALFLRRRRVRRVLRLRRE